MRRVLQKSVEQVGRRCVRYMPEIEMRRPEESSKMYRAVQDWKPLAHEVAHSAGKQPEEESVRLHMVLIDRQGFRWPVRFNLVPGMTLWDIFNKTDQQWFDLSPRWMDHNIKQKYGVKNGQKFFGLESYSCNMGSPHMTRCPRCMVLVPYEYLDAMAPPDKWEIDYLQRQVWFGRTQGTANMRVACQVYVEEWMDGMTIVLPQEESFAYQMYYSQGVDKASIDGASGSGHSGVKNFSDGRVTPSSERYNRPDAHMKTRDFDHQFESGSENPNLPLSSIFWTDSVDDVIRQRYPSWKGRYELLNK